MKITQKDIDESLISTTFPSDGLEIELFFVLARRKI